VLLKPDLSSTWSLGLTRSGALYVWKPAGAAYVTVADFDAATGEIRPAPAPMFQAFIDSRGRPAWSADGKRLLYVSCNSSGGSNCRIFIRDMEKGTTREVPHNLSYVSFPRFGPDGNTIVTQGTDLKGRRAIYLIDATTGSTKFIADKPDFPVWTDWWPDGRSIYYANQGPNEPLVLFRREIGSDVAAEIFRTSACSRSARVRVSPDGHAIACTLRDPGTRTTALMVVPLDGGAAKPLMRAREPEGFSPSSQWMPDGRAMLIRKVVPGGADELWLAPLDGEPRRLNVDVRNWNGGPGDFDFDLSPDGRRIAFVASAGAQGAEVWALEHFLTPAAGTR
jgi:Tol biopolymer transport system component